MTANLAFAKAADEPVFSNQSVMSPDSDRKLQNSAEVLRESSRSQIYWNDVDLMRLGPAHQCSRVSLCHNVAINFKSLNSGRI